MKMRTPAVWLLCAVLLAAPAAHAEPAYTDEDSDYLKVTGFFLEPVGRWLEWLVFRPIHFVHHVIDPWDRVEGGPERVCTGLRPRRGCRPTQ
jgi:hypothetical protein